VPPGVVEEHLAVVEDAHTTTDKIDYSNEGLAHYAREVNARLNHGGKRP
jgi:hypothetical protein